MRRCFLSIVVMFCVAVASSVAFAEERIALVIGNSNYIFAPLPNPKNDAKLMSQTLKGLGFDVITTINGSQIEMKQAIQLFGKKLSEAGKEGVGLFFYAGHGVQVGGTNYLIPVDAKIESEGDVDLYSINASAVLRQMEYSNVRLSFVIIDACRDNPFSRGFRSGSRGLARMEAARGSLIAYATAPGDVAADGVGENSPYTQALTEMMNTPGLPVERMFREVRNQVGKVTNGKQTPWESSSLVGGNFYFNPEKAAAPQAKTNETALPVDQKALELAFWNSIQGSDDAAMFRAYLEQYPSGTFTPLAQAKVKKLTGSSHHTASLATQMFALQNANIRSAPDAKAAKVGSLSTGDAIDVTGETKVSGATWYRVALTDGGLGFVLGRLLGDKPVAVQPAMSHAPPVMPGSGVFKIEMVDIPPGKFRMGDLKGGGDSDEKPVRRVTIDHSFAVGKYEVTQAQWRAVMSSDPSQFRGDDNPVERVSWSDAKTFIRKLNAQTGQNFRLLTEAEWEYVARAKTTTNYSWGDGIGVNNANCSDCGSPWDNSMTAPVGSFPPNAFGVHDMHGNVWEWVEDCYDKNYGSSPTNGSARQGGTSCFRVNRGGAWINRAQNLRSANRSEDYSNRRSSYLGFRLAETR